MVRHTNNFNKVVLKKTILLGSNTLWSIYNFREGLISALIGDGVEVLAVAPDDAFRADLQRLGCRVIPFPIQNAGVNPLRDGLVIWRNTRLIATHRPDICLWYTIKPSVYGSIACWVMKTPTCMTITGLGTAFIAGGALERLAKILLRLIRSIPEKVFVQNRDDIRLLTEEKLFRKDKLVHVSGSGINLERFAFRPKPETCEIRFVFIGRLIRDKGVYEYVKAATEVGKRFDRVEFLLVGSSDVANRTAVDKEEIVGWVNSGKVKYLRQVRDVRPIIEWSDCVVLPSYREGFPRVLVEACAIGRPVISTDVPGCREVVKHGENGYICKARDASDLQRAMELFLRLSSEDRELMGRRARLKAELEFGENEVIQIYKENINSILVSSEA